MLFTKLLAYCYYQGDQNSMSNFFQEKLFFAKLQFLFNFFLQLKLKLMKVMLLENTNNYNAEIRYIVHIPETTEDTKKRVSKKVKVFF